MALLVKIRDSKVIPSAQLAVWQRIGLNAMQWRGVILSHLIPNAFLDYNRDLDSLRVRKRQDDGQRAEYFRSVECLAPGGREAVLQFLDGM